jgi:hypothetical protein
VSDLIYPPQDLYEVEFERRPGDLGVSVIIRADCASMARVEAWRLFPEHKRASSGTFVHLLDFAEIDWDSGQCFVAKRKRRRRNPLFNLDEPLPLPAGKKRGEEGAQ